MSKKEISLIFGAVCFVLVFCIFIQIKSVESTNTEIGQTITENNLRDELLTIKARYDTLEEELDYAETNLEKIRKAVAEDDENAKSIEEQVTQMNKMLGLVELKGEGVIVTLEDNKTVSVENLAITDNISYYLVHYIDIIEVINELWNAGAEAISINGQRIVSNSAIVCIGNVVSINGQKIGAPFVISAIGQAETLYGALTRPESYLKVLSRDGVLTDVKKSNDVVVAKYMGTYTSEFLENVDSED